MYIFSHVPNPKFLKWAHLTNLEFLIGAHPKRKNQNSCMYKNNTTWNPYQVWPYQQPHHTHLAIILAIMKINDFLGRKFLGHLNINLANNFNVKYVSGKDSPLLRNQKNQRSLNGVFVKSLSLSSQSQGINNDIKGIWRLISWNSSTPSIFFLFNVNHSMQG